MSSMIFGGGKIFVSIIAFGLLGLAFGGVVKAQNDPFARLPHASVNMVSTYVAPEEKIDSVNPVFQDEKPREVVYVEMIDQEDRSYKTWILVGGLILVLSGALVKSSKKGLMIWSLALCLCPLEGEATSVQAFLDRPIPHQVYSTHPQSSFRYLVVEGGIVDQATNRGIFEGQTIDLARLVFMKGMTSVFQNVPVDTITVEEGYRFYFMVEIPADEPLLQGDYVPVNVNIEFIINQEVFVLPLVDSEGTLQPIILDSHAPSIGLEYLSDPQQARSEPMELKVTCHDGGIGCLKEELILTIHGNFCNDPALCGDRQAGHIEICDQVDNCRVQNIEVKGYDPLTPVLKRVHQGNETLPGWKMERTQMGRVWGTSTGKTTLAADDTYRFTVYLDDGQTQFLPHIRHEDGTIELITPQDTTCTIGENAYSWCVPGETIDWMNCCVPSMESHIFDLYQPHICRDTPETEMQEGCRLKDQNCQNHFGERGVLKDGHCFIQSCPIGFIKGRSKNNEGRCYSDNTPFWGEICELCQGQKQLCRPLCQLPNGMVLDDQYCPPYLKPRPRRLDCVN